MCGWGEKVGGVGEDSGRSGGRSEEWQDRRVQSSANSPSIKGKARESATCYVFGSVY